MNKSIALERALGWAALLVSTLFILGLALPPMQ